MEEIMERAEKTLDRDRPSHGRHKYTLCQSGLQCVVMRRVAVIAIPLAGTAVFAAPPEPCSLASTVTDAKVTIAIPDGQTLFREGEIIQLALSFTSTADKRYWAHNRNYDRSGRLTIETYCVEPAARDPLADYFRAGAFMGGGRSEERRVGKECRSRWSPGL